ncbi:hypothetical protein SLOPH_1194 [Spraguea lophii 42_110]|uniref:Uncharacterized protein n=1 Tax=Spraguea lophii (strain 42_110) TaxID=1358809 RepID=S7XH11_SPRLO|nr:hypothetical protein SLOPH_1194 [Spraguea lophii 42_110]
MIRFFSFHPPMNQFKYIYNFLQFFQIKSIYTIMWIFIHLNISKASINSEHSNITWYVEDSYIPLSCFTYLFFNEKTRSVNDLRNKIINTNEYCTLKAQLQEYFTKNSSCERDIDKYFSMLNEHMKEKTSVVFKISGMYNQLKDNLKRYSKDVNDIYNIYKKVFEKSSCQGLFNDTTKKALLFQKLLETYSERKQDETFDKSTCFTIIYYFRLFIKLSLDLVNNETRFCGCISSIIHKIDKNTVNQKLITRSSDNKPIFKQILALLVIVNQNSRVGIPDQTNVNPEDNVTEYLNELLINPNLSDDKSKEVKNIPDNHNQQPTPTTESLIDIPKNPKPIDNIPQKEKEPPKNQIKKKNTDKNNGRISIFQMILSAIGILQITIIFLFLLKPSFLSYLQIF